VRDVNCETHPHLCTFDALPDHVRTQTFVGLRLGLGASIGLGEGFQVAVTLPIQLKAFTIAHALPDGTPYDTPYSLLTGPSEVEVGLGDTEVLVRMVRRVPGSPLLLQWGAGAALPTGRTSANPFDPALPASRRQQRQFGNGTVDPRVDLGVGVGTDPIGLLGSMSFRIPVYANRFGYTGQRTVGGSLGVVVTPGAPIEKLRLMLAADASWASPARWNDEPALNSGGGMVGVRMGFEWAFKPQASLRGAFTVLPVQVMNGEQFLAPFVASIGLSGVIDVRPKKKDAHVH